MYKYFTNKELYILNRFGIILENRLYTKKEFEVINMHLYKHYKTDKADRILDNPFFVENGFTKKDYEKILNIFNKIAIDYNL